MQITISCGKTANWNGRNFKKLLAVKESAAILE
jgi:hypothetical protein